MDARILAKLCWNNFLFWFSRKANYPFIAPDMVQVNFSFKCNLTCSMCNMHEQMNFLKSKGRRTEIDSETFKKVIEETKELGAKTVLFIGGEPLLRNDLFDLIDYAKALGLNTVIVTNAVLLDEKCIGQCMDSGVSWLSVSIDAATDSTFAKIRGKDMLKTIAQNVRNLDKARKEKGVEFAKVGIVCTIMNDNLEELLDVALLSKELGAEKIIFQPVVTNNADQSCRDSNSSIFIDESRFSVLDNAINGLIAFKKSSPENYNFIANSLRHLALTKRYLKKPLCSNRWPCYAGFNRLQIAQDYRVYFCIPPTKDIDASFGDVSEQSLKDIWYSKDAKLRRRLIKKCNVPCLQWCSYRDDFTVLSEVFQKTFLFRLGLKGKNDFALEKKRQK